MCGRRSALVRTATLAATLLAALPALELHATDHRHDLERDTLVAHEAAHPAAPHHFEAAEATLSRSCACALSSHRPAISAPAAIAMDFGPTDRPGRSAAPARTSAVPHSSDTPRGPPAA